MAKKPPLRVVNEGDAPERSKTDKTVTQAATSGTRRELLVAMRDRVAKTVEDKNTLARDLAALTRRLLEITNEIEAIDQAAEEESGGNHEAPDESYDASAI